MKHDHRPTESAGRSYGSVPGLKPWRQGERQICNNCGKTIRFVEGYALRRDYWAVLPERANAIFGRRRGQVAGCPRCGPGLRPPHDASPRCESGRRNHCSCDTCF